eukprot:SAG25_NODE_4111_length_887_cov_1.596447_2_plen_110_part_01
MTGMDADSSGEVDFGEFEQWWAEASAGAGDSKLVQALKDVEAQQARAAAGISPWAAGFVAGRRFDVFKLLSAVWREGMTGAALAEALAGEPPPPPAAEVALLPHRWQRRW